MFWFITICLSNLMKINGFVIQDTFNVLLKDDADYKVDLIITDADYEMIDQKELKPFKIEGEKEKFKKLNAMAQLANYQASQIKKKAENQYLELFLPNIVANIMNNESNSVISAFIGSLQSTTIRTTIKKGIEENNTDEYDYDNLVNEYYDESNNESLSKNAYHILESETAIKDYGTYFTSFKNLFTTTNCSAVQGIGLLALKCLLINSIDQRQSARELMARLWKIFQIWFFVYLGIAIPLWCTRGWCCCCLCCKFFKPRQTIEEAKKYLIAYPPGVFKNKNGEIRYYEPSDREKQCYEEFEHFIKTL